jgi:hypothetical protein
MFSNFLADMGPAEGLLQLDRIDNDGNYERSNCRWASRLENCNNKGNHRFVSFNGEQMTISQFARKCGVNQRTMYQRINNGWSAERASVSPI